MKHVFPFLILAVLAACSREAPPKAHKPSQAFVPATVVLGDATVSLPKQVEEWIRPDASRRITAETIFDYMDGAGEMYLAYRFDHLDVFEYKPANESAGTILVELYSMKTPEDAFGLLSNDWGGDPPPLAAARSEPPDTFLFPPYRALYGAGLMRLWNGPLYARILASKETPYSHGAVEILARELLGQRGPQAAMPAVLSLPRVGYPVHPCPCSTGEGHVADFRKTCFFRSHLVLNSQYFLASQDILGLGLDTEAATTEYKPYESLGKYRLRVIVIRYPSSDRAKTGLKSFRAVYLRDGGGRGPQSIGAVKTEHAWVGWAQRARDLVITLDAAEDWVAKGMAEALLQSVESGGNAGK